MNESFPFISIIIPTYRNWAKLALCIEAINNQTYPKSRYEVIIVNNDKYDEIPISVLDLQYSNVTFLTELMPGSYAARNAGIKYSRGSIVAFTDSDCYPEADWLETAANLFIKYKQIDRVAGAVSIFREPEGSWFAWKFDSITAFNQKFNVAKGTSVTANLYVRRDTFNQIGDFNSSLMSGGDIEWNQRASAYGYNIYYSPDTVVRHPARLSFKDLVSKTRRVIGGKFVAANSFSKKFKLVLWHFYPPLRYAKALVQNNRNIIDVVFAVLVFWLLKVVMIGEIIRLILGGRPIR